MEAASAPTVLYPLTLPALLSYALTSRPGAPTTLLVCSSRESFLQALSDSLRREHGHDDADQLQQLMLPTLRNLALARHVNIAFCPSVPALLAHLSAYSGSQPKPGTGQHTEKETLIMVNPIELHVETPSFSAQGLSRTFATAVEAAVRVDAKLVVVEGLQAQGRGGIHNEVEGQNAEVRNTEGSSTELDPCDDPWEQEVPILNVSARRFAKGSGERPWAGRTVKVSTIAERWFRFRKVGSGSG